MQLIPLVLTLFLILTLAINSMQKWIRQEIVVQNRLDQHFSLQEQLYEIPIALFLEKNTYVETKRRSDGTASKEKKTKRKSKSNRFATATSRHSRLLLAPLLLRENPELFKVALTFLKELYKYAPEIDVDKLLEELLVKGKVLLEKNLSVKTLSVFDVPHPSENLKQALAGTKGYRYGNGCGYPCLDDFVYLYAEKYSHCIAAPYASAPLLIALLGPKKAEYIFEKEALLSEEAETEKYLSKTEMQELLIEKHSPLSTNKERLLGDQKFPAQKRNGKQIIVMDSNLQLEARQTLYTYQVSRAPHRKEMSKETPSTPDVLMSH